MQKYKKSWYLQINDKSFFTLQTTSVCPPRSLSSKGTESRERYRKCASLSLRGLTTKGKSLKGIESIESIERLRALSRLRPIRNSVTP